ncbi:hypothetical protein VKT23_009394 [Stygiomarasmius scandens]|uniref:Protein kinase domain-containing protein n=1 Tax=Marasmiellus scandens TaxID=2682957 RepID=A0ABR1JLE7_9AGAR
MSRDVFYCIWQGDNQFIEGQVSISSTTSWRNFLLALITASTFSQTVRDEVFGAPLQLQLWSFHQPLPIDPNNLDLVQIEDLLQCIRNKQYTSVDTAASTINLILDNPRQYLIVKAPGLLGVDILLPQVLYDSDIKQMCIVNVASFAKADRDSEQTIQKMAVMYSMSQTHHPRIPEIERFRNKMSRKRWISSELRNTSIYQSAKALFQADQWATLYDESLHHNQEFQPCTPEELAALECIGRNHARITQFHAGGSTDSSSLRVTHFCWLFTSYPFALDPMNKRAPMDHPAYEWTKSWKWDYGQDQKNGLKILYRTSNNQMRKLSPKSDLMLVDKKWLFSPLFGEIDSNDGLRDKWRMLAQSLVQSRIATAAQADIKIISTPFVHKDLSVDFIYTYTYHGIATYMLEEKFDIKNVLDALGLFRFFYNFRDFVKAKSGLPLQHCPVITNSLRNFKYEAITTTKDETTEDLGGDPPESGHERSGSDSTIEIDDGSTSSSSSDSLDWSTEHSTYNKDKLLTPWQHIINNKDLLAVCLSSIQVVRESDACRLKNVPKHPHVVQLRSVTDETLAFLKILKAKETKVLQWLMNHPDSSRFFCLPHRIIQIEGNMIGVFAAEGLPLHRVDYSGVEFSVACQLLRCVSVLHSLNVCHLDIKLENLVWNRTSSALKMLDFGVSVIQTNRSNQMSGFVGTRGFTAPEIGVGPYNPYEVDNYAVGLALKSILYTACEGSARSCLEDWAQAMMDDRVEPTLVLDDFVDHFPQYAS